MRRSARLSLLPLATLLAACFRLVGPEQPPPVAAALVDVSVEYRQPNGCLNVTLPCEEPVVFFASWMKPGGEFRLTRDTGGHVWRGVAHGVPANWPPSDSPYEIRVFDPYLKESPTSGFSGDRIVLGGEALTHLEGGDSPSQHTVAYVDQNGQGHNPY
jgi:hypothetical protein